MNNAVLMPLLVQVSTVALNAALGTAEQLKSRPVLFFSFTQVLQADTKHRGRLALLLLNHDIPCSNLSPESRYSC
jgi:hypothetical protein